MQPFRIASVFLVVAAGLVVDPVAGRADELNFKIDGTKVSEFQGKAFNLKDAPGFSTTAPGFDKAFKGYGTGGASGWVDRRADIGGRDVYAPDVKVFDKAFAVPQTSLFQEASPFSTQTAPFSMADAPLAKNAKLDNFGTQVPFANKAYTGPENERLRQAMAQLLDKDQAIGVPDPLRPAPKGDAMRAQLNAAGGHIAPIITVQDVKGLLNKDVAPVSPNAVPEAAAQGGTTPAKAGAQGVTVK